MRRKLMQRDVERLKLKPWIESVRSWINVGVEATILEQAERYATNQKLKIWENYVKGQELSNGSTALETKQKRHLYVLGGGRFYLQSVGDQKLASIQNHFASMCVKDDPIIASFNSKRGDILLAQFLLDYFWNRAMIVNAPRGAVEMIHLKCSTSIMETMK
ncbi:ribonuclease TUDOR 2-like isoform X1 [Brassica napus]|uniref:ribonuclease TUDOR 2-like isoform X1 n=1 Tax=Brassica napus TaxID=3708 RepID=UPI002078E30E|nr:ribonuclease TUDOR 2-like isoform X1 [Brassica napus]XP_048630205.1 ribonuclease TUDOR 2-like isoform X1 [Brassica napus]XP_048630232.1 ribonuclease TUDOR 2-like isoform X1 [Brassica napus]